MVAAHTVLVGDLTLKDNLVVDGCIEGSVRSSAQVSIGNQGSIQGNVTARHLIVCGQLEGQIRTARLELVAGARLKGEIHTTELVMEDGAHFNGRIQTSPSAWPAPGLAEAQSDIDKAG